MACKGEYGMHGHSTINCCQSIKCPIFQHQMVQVADLIHMNECSTLYPVLDFLVSTLIRLNLVLNHHSLFSLSALSSAYVLFHKQVMLMT